jgi:hypothetical protein
VIAAVALEVGASATTVEGSAQFFPGCISTVSVAIVAVP